MVILCICASVVHSSQVRRNILLHATAIQNESNMASTLLCRLGKTLTAMALACLIMLRFALLRMKLTARNLCKVSFLRSMYNPIIPLISRKTSGTKSSYSLDNLSWNFQLII